MRAGVAFAFVLPLGIETTALIRAVASYFFSLWSIRGILGLGCEGFPTLLDVGILTLCMLIHGASIRKHRITLPSLL